ncbi:MAG: right-handed parallel beta-helix repeat-containing protein [Armatimonadota bacterium]
MRNRFLLFVPVLIAILATSASSAVIRVKWDSPNNGPGNDWSHAYRTVTAGIAASVSDDEIWVAGDSAHPYYERITLKTGVGLYGGFAGTETTHDQRNWKTNVTILDGSGTGRVVTAPSDAYWGETTLDGFTVRNSGTGYSSSDSGIYCYETRASIRNNTIVGNYNGIYSSSSLSSITENTILANSHGIVCDSSTPSITNNTISGNSYAGIDCKSGSFPNIANNTISGNGYTGINCVGSSPRIASNTISGNSSYGIFCTNSAAPSITNNIVAFSAAGVYNQSGSSSPPEMKSNCVYNPGGVNYSGNVSAGPGDISADPLFVSRASGDLHLSHLSPCIDAGLDSAVISEMDLDGLPRITGVHVDIGADEYMPPPIITDDGVYTSITTELHATWISPFPVNRIVEYRYAIGTSPTDPGSGYTVAWKSTGTAIAATETGLNLLSGTTYYWYVKAYYDSGYWSREAGVSDGVVLAPTIAHLAGVKGLTPDSAFTLNGLVACTSSTDFAGFVYVQDTSRASGIGVNTTATINRGDIISLAGRVRRVDGEWQIDLLQPPAVVGGVALQPMHIIQRAISTDPNEDLTPDWGLNPAGLLVKISGRITRINTTDHVIYVNDGTSLTDGLGPSDNPYVGIRVGYRTMTPPLVGKRITVTGILSVEKTTLIDDAFVNGEYRLAGETLYVPILRPRNQADIVVVL